MSRYGRDRDDRGCKVYVGDLGDNGRQEEIENAFKAFGRLKEVWVARNPPGFAYVTFEDPLDAEDSIKELDGTTLCGERVRVEQARGPRGGGRGGRAPPRDSKCYSCGRMGHFARDCRSGGGGGSYNDRRGGGGRSRYSRSRSRSRSPYRRDRDRDRGSRY